MPALDPDKGRGRCWARPPAHSSAATAVRMGKHTQNLRKTFYSTSGPFPRRMLWAINSWIFITKSICSSFNPHFKLPSEAILTCLHHIHLCHLAAGRAIATLEGFHEVCGQQLLSSLLAGRSCISPSTARQRWLPPELLRLSRQWAKKKNERDRTQQSGKINHLLWHQATKLHNSFTWLLQHRNPIGTKCLQQGKCQMTE